MRKIANDLKHGTTSFQYVLARSFQKAAYFGLRAILVLFLMDSIGSERVDALYWYGLFTGLYLVSQFICSLISDLIQRNREMMLLGVVLQVVGALLIIGIMKFWAIGLTIFTIGGALFEDNQTSLFSRLYELKHDLLDAGFSLLIVGVNIGAMLGILAIGYAYESIGFQWAFFIAALLSAASGVVMLFTKSHEYAVISLGDEEDLLDEGDLLDFQYVTVNADRNSYWIYGVFLCIAVLILGTPLSSGLFDIQYSLSELYDSFSMVGPFISMGLGALLTIFWSYYYNSQYAKLIVGIFLFLLFYVSLSNMELLFGGDSGIVLFVILTILFESTYLFFGPIVYSLISQNTKPRFRATLYALSRVPEKLFTYLGLTAIAFADLPQIWGLGVLFLFLGCSIFLYLKNSIKTV